MSEFETAFQAYIASAVDAIANRQIAIPVRDWLYVSDEGENRKATRLGQHVNDRQLAHDVELAMRGSSECQALIESFLVDESLAENMLVRAMRDRFEGDLVASAYPNGERVWTLRSVVNPILTEYFRRAGTDQYDEGALSHVLRQARFTLLAPGIVTWRLIPLRHVIMNVEIIRLADNVTLRRLTETEIEEWMNPLVPDQPGMPPVYEFFSLSCVAEITSRQLTSSISDQSRAHEELNVLTGRVLTILRLVLDADVHPAFWEQRSALANSILRPIDPFPRTNLAGRQGVIDAESIEPLRQTWSDLGYRQQDSKLALAIRRWDDAANRVREDDRLIDYWIALESLFAPDSTYEVRFRAALRIAAFVGKDGAERARIYEELLKSYDCRSAIVHGDEKRLRKLSVADCERNTRRHLRAALLRILGAPSFDPTSTERMLLRDSLPVGPTA